MIQKVLFYIKKYGMWLLVAIAALLGITYEVKKNTDKKIISQDIKVAVDQSKIVTENQTEKQITGNIKTEQAKIDDIKKEIAKPAISSSAVAPQQEINELKKFADENK